MAVSRQEFTRHSRKVTATRRWQVLRQQILERDGWKCCTCGERRRLEVDHIKPVRTHPELSFEPRNLQVLCGACHSRKTRIEVGHKEKSPDRKAWFDAVAELARPSGWSIPRGMRHSSVPVTIVCGPPGAGKTTYVRENAAPQDTIIDFDDCLRSVGGVAWDEDPSKVRAAFRARDDLLRGLTSQRRGRAWLIVTAPRADERAAWKRNLMRASVVLLDVDPDTCKARIRAAPERLHAVDQMCAGVDRWWRIHAADLVAQSDTSPTEKE